MRLRHVDAHCYLLFFNFTLNPLAKCQGGPNQKSQLAPYPSAQVAPPMGVDGSQYLAAHDFISMGFGVKGFFYHAGRVDTSGPCLQVVLGSLNVTIN